MMFSVGDRVVGIQEYEGSAAVAGNHGTILSIKEAFVTIVFDKPVYSTGYHKWNFPIGRLSSFLREDPDDCENDVEKFI